jgi:hypothetical protein
MRLQSRGRLGSNQIDIPTCEVVVGSRFIPHECIRFIARPVMIST